MSDPQTPVRIGHVLILPDGTRKPLSSAVDEAHEDAYGASAANPETVTRLVIPVSEEEEEE